MKNRIQKAIIMLGVAMTAFTACKKENVNDVQQTVNVDAEIATLNTQANGDMMLTDADGTTPELGIMLTNEGIAEDYLVEANDLDEVEGVSRRGNDDSLKRIRQHIRSHSFVACLRKMNFTDSQKAAVKRTLYAYEDCKHDAVKRARLVYAKLKDAYRDKAERLIKAYKNGDLTQAQFEKAMKELRIAFNKELRAKQIDEKLHEALRDCHKIMLVRLQKLLTAEQWKAFVACYKR